MVDFRTVKDESDLMIITREGVAIRMPVESIPTIGRNTQGVKLIRLDEGEAIASICLVPKDEEEAEESNLMEGSTGEHTSEEELGEESSNINIEE